MTFGAANPSFLALLRRIGLWRFAWVVLSAVAVLLIALAVCQRKGSGARTEPLLHVTRADLVMRGGRWHQTGDTNPFTGFLEEFYETGSLRSRSMVSNGLLHGLSEGWFTNGQLQVTEHFRTGVSHGPRTKWYVSGGKLSQAMIADGKFHGRFQRWNENGALAERVEFNAGSPDGLSLAYFPSGFLKARATLRGGQVVRQRFWKDGELKEAGAEDDRLP